MTAPLSLFSLFLLLALVHFAEVGAVRDHGTEPEAPAEGQSEAERQGVQGNEAVQQPHALLPHALLPHALLPPADAAMARHGQIVQEAVQRVVANLDPTGRASNAIAQIAMTAIQTYMRLQHEELRRMGLVLQYPTGQHAPPSASEYQSNQLNQLSTMQTENAGTSSAAGPIVSTRPRRRGRGPQKHNMAATGQSEANTISGTPVVSQGLPSQPIGVQGEHSTMGQHHSSAPARQRAHSVLLASTLAQHRSSGAQPAPSPALMSNLMSNSDQMTTLNAMGGGQTPAQLLQQQQWAAQQQLFAHQQFAQQQWARQQDLAQQQWAAQFYEQQKLAKQEMARQMSMPRQKRHRGNHPLEHQPPPPLQAGEAGPTTLGGAADDFTALQLGTPSASGSREQGQQPATGATASANVPSVMAFQFQRKIPPFRKIVHGLSAAELAEFQQQVAMAQPSSTGASASQHQLPSTAGVTAGASPALLDLLSSRAAFGHQPPTLTSSHQPVSLEGHDPNAANPSTSRAVGLQLFPLKSGNEAAEDAEDRNEIPTAKRPRN